MTPKAITSGDVQALQAQLDAMRAAIGYVPAPPKTPAQRLQQAAANIAEYATDTHGGRATALLAVTLADVIDVLSGLVTPGPTIVEEPTAVAA
jgi:hypothetical protein